VSTATRQEKECLLITKNGIVLEKFIGLQNGSYETTIKQVTSNVEVFSSTLDKKGATLQIMASKIRTSWKKIFGENIESRTRCKCTC
jgi:hypothetical protein